MTTIALSSNLDPLVIDKIIEALTPLKSIPASQIAVIHDKIAEHFQAPSVRNGVQKEIGDLANMLCTIEGNFSIIERLLRRIDENELVVVNGKPVVYATEWGQYHDEYTEIVQISQETANRTKVEIGDLVERVIPIIQSSAHVAAKRQALERYILNLSRFEGGASEVDKRFFQLGRNVDAFRRALKTSVAHQIDPRPSSAQADKRIAEIDTQIAMLRAGLERIGGLFRGTMNVARLATPIAVKSVVPVIAAGAPILAVIAGLTALAPIIAGSLLAVAITSTVAYSINVGVKEHNSQKKAKKKDIKDLVDEKERLTATITYKHLELRAVSQEMNKLESTFGEITSRLSSIQCIWQMLLYDTQNLRRDLEDLRPLENNDELARKLSSIKALFGTLYFALDQYTLQVKAS